MSAASFVTSLRAALAGKLDDADRRGEQEEHAGHGEKGEKAENQRLRLIGADETQADDRPDERAGEQKHQPDMAGAFRPIDRRDRRRIVRVSHEDPTTSRITVMPDAASAARWSR